jgi:hypothetical protein
MIRTLLAVSLLALGAGAAQAQTRPVQIGTLDCNVAGGVGLIVGSQKQMRCVFRRSGRDEIYVGRITRFGLDVGVTRRARMVWSVFAPTTGVGRGALAGTYAGASAQATVGAGVGANVLVGGGSRSFSLQPLSVQGQTGLNLALGVAGLDLALARPRAQR